MIRIRCKNCNRILGDFKSANGEIRCPRCKETNPLNLIDNSNYIPEQFNQKVINGTNKLQTRLYRSN